MHGKRLEDISYTDCYNITEEINDICHGSHTLKVMLLMIIRGYRQKEICDKLHLTNTKYHILKNQIRRNYVNYVKEAM